MKLLFDFFPILLFFISYKWLGIYIATAVTIVASILQVGWIYYRYRKLEPVHLITLASVVILGGATLLFHNELFIKWKPTAIYWLMALAFLISHFMQKNLIYRMMSSQIELPKKIWKTLNLCWVAFFVFMGALNIYVVYHFSTNTWVDFKLFGTLILTLIFGVGQALYLSQHIKERV